MWPLIAYLLVAQASQSSYTCAKPEQYYQVSDGTDWEPAISRAIHAYTPNFPVFRSWLPQVYGAEICLGPNRYHVDHTIVIDREVNFHGVQGGGWFSSSEIECGSGLNPCMLLNGSWAYLHDFSIRGDSKSPWATQGMYMTARTMIERVYLRGFSKDCLDIWADHGYWPGTNANGFSLRGLLIDNCGGDGVSIRGGDASAGIIEGVDISSVTGRCFLESSFLGNTYLANQCASASGSYVTTNANAANVFLGNYAEGNTPGPVINRPSIWFGGMTGQPIKSGVYYDSMIFDRNTATVRTMREGPYQQLRVWSAYGIPTSTTVDPNIGIRFHAGDEVVASFPKPGGCERWRLSGSKWKCAARLDP